MDGFDETILPLDFEEAGQILDDEIHVRREGGREGGRDVRRNEREIERQ